MIDEELSLKIAEAHEPRPTMEPRCATEHGERSNPRFDEAVATLKFWEYVYYTGWRPCSYSRPDIALRLLKELIDDFSTVIAHKDYIRAEPTIGKYFEGKAYGEGIEKAIAEAWIAAKGTS